MEIHKPRLLECAVLAVVASLAYAQGPAAGGGSVSRPAGEQKALAAQGKTRFQAYKCYDCHGEHGEGTPDAPDLTHSKLNAEQVSKFLVKPSADALNKGMPDIPADNPDNRLLVAYVMSLRVGGNRPVNAPEPKRPAGAPSSTPSKGAAASGSERGSAAVGGSQSALVAKGKERFQAYKCYDCHGEHGEGTPDAPDLTHSKLTAEQVSKFLVKPSADAQNKGMPDIPKDSPDHDPLVAYVMSLRAK